MSYWVTFITGLLAGIIGMLGTPKSREQMREHRESLRQAYMRGYATGYHAGILRGADSARQVAKRALRQ